MTSPTMIIPLPADLAALPEARVHWLPCTIHADREANVDKYFLPQLVSPSNPGAAETSETAVGDAAISLPTGALSQYRASFRGRRLDGQVPELHGFSAIVVETFEAAEAAGQIGDQSQGETNDDDMEVDAALNSTPTLRLTPVARVVDPIVWDHDQLPLVHTSAVLKGLEWARLSSAVHEPVLAVCDTAESAASSCE